jgi:hypothetical protein
LDTAEKDTWFYLSRSALYVDSPNSNGWMNGTISWGKGPCAFWSNGGGILQGHLLCNSNRDRQQRPGGAASNTLTFVGNYMNNGIGEASLTE